MSDPAHTKLNFTNLDGGGRIAWLEFHRPDQANAFSAEMMHETTGHLKSLAVNKDVRLLVISGAGKHFSGGADLNWMKASAKLSFDENIIDANRLRDMFESIIHFQAPKIALVRGAAYGGAVGIIACCDYAIADESAKFCLSEAKLGLAPAVIAPYLLRKMRHGALRRFALTSRVFSAKDALEAGLIEIVTGSIEDTLREEINALLTCGPNAQMAINQLFNHLRNKNWSQCEETVETISRLRTSTDGQAGLSSFFSKSSPPWLRSFSKP